MKILSGLLGLILAATGAEAAQSIIVGEITDTGDTISFSFTTTCLPGTNHQPQYNTSLTGEWVDIPDAQVLETDEPDRFDVVAPRFGAAAEFFRVVDADTAAEAPIAPTLDEPAPPREDQILLLLNERRVSGSGLTGKFFSFAEASPDGELPASLQPLAANEYAGDLRIGGSNAQDAVSVDLTGNGVPDPVFCWSNNDDELILVLPEVNGEGDPWESPRVYPVPGPPIYTASLNANAMIRMVPVELDGDELPEIALAYKDENAVIQLMTLDFGGDVDTAPAFSARDESTQLDTGDLIRSARFDLAAGNFDNDSDGLDELVIVTTMPVAIDGGSENFRLFAKFFRATTEAITHVDAITPEETEIYVKNGRSTIWLNRVAATAADFNGDGTDDLAVGFMVRNNSSQGFWYLQGFSVDEALESVANLTRAANDEFNVRNLYQASGSPGHPMAMIPLQLDDDPAAELLFAARNTDFFEFDSAMTPTDIGGGTIRVDDIHDSRRHVALANFESPEDPEAFDFPELVSVREFDTSQGSGNPDLSTIELTVNRIVRSESGSYRLEEISSTQDEIIENNNLGRAMNLAVATFDALDFKLGVPRRSTRILADRPTVILNAPPVHFDVIDGVEYDVNNIFPTRDLPPQGSPFFSRFTRITGETVQVETQWKRSWDISIKAEGGFGIPLTPVKVEAEVRTKFGQEFDNYTQTTETTTVEVQIEAVDDDRLYATTLSYEIWEYPVVLNENTIVGYIILVEPSVTRQNWFFSKSIVAQNYRPYHEVGNLLSYDSATTPQYGFEFVRPIEADTFTIGASGGNSSWKLTKTIGETTTESSTFNFEIGATTSFDIPIPFVPDVEVSGDYRSSDIESSTSQITDTNGLLVQFGTLDGTVAGATYSVTPYLYWAEMGALVLDFAVDLPLGTPSIPTFWRDFYGQKPDPTFILPWRLDPEKGIAVSPILQRLTRDISTLPLEPRLGQDVKVQARLSNFSLLNAGDPFVCRFYYGDPADGGELIHEETVPAGFEERGRRLIEFDWTTPSDHEAASFTIYCVVDATNVIDEIHEDNNIAFGEIFIRKGPQQQER